MPELELDPCQPRLVEVYESSTDSWTRFRIEKFAIDGRVMVKKLRTRLWLIGMIFPSCDIVGLVDLGLLGCVLRFCVSVLY